MASVMAISRVACSAPMNSKLGGGSLIFSSKAAPVLSLRTRRKWSGVVQASSSGTADENLIPDSPSGRGGYSYVDDNMMILRRRIEGMRMKETFTQTPDEWMEWERSCYNTYRADINILVATLHSQLLGMRPGVVLALFSFFLAVTPVAALLLASAVGSQLYSGFNAVVDVLAPAPATPPL